MKQVAPKAQAALNTWLDYLLAIHPTEIDMGLVRVSEVASRLGLTELGMTKVVTVAGTNGKGTTCAMIEAALQQTGKTVGVYSSPHLLHYNERVRINGVDATDEALVSAFEAIESARTDISLSFFEYATLAGLVLFKREHLDVILLEVGLGGRLDATNIIDADISVVTSIDLDHQEYLGDTRELVAAEKAGIFRAGRAAIVGEPDCPQTLIDYAQSISANLYRVGHEFNYTCHGADWHYSGQHFNLNSLPLPKLPQPNAATAIAVLEHLSPDIDKAAIADAVGNTQLAGRLEHVCDKPRVMVDVAHNPHAARYLRSRLENVSKQRLFAICGMLKDKDATAVLSELSLDITHWYLSDLNVPRGATALALKALLPLDSQASCFATIGAAWNAVKQDAKGDDMVIVFGSFYTVAAFKELLKGESFV
ncbi:bifunctional tetrahydrofolate synthase/dihydrofolate synthase [Shewanella sp. KX20019]|uniref:bifunctional tetrahydrofolate synthase/dihydrofolate synthase n=1 Tax=Shewanella sp. KX20019 TaxID=2803864 RepID=UPI0019287EEA|nr:bifunctional tetrahydrofolate synthase/dihydrofolate synthase [Shewanella sp. KX20019]QQX82572.1 bifunctional tetrahydrofolate synthase/dihydrofolate synthase [Shewanella sp. KX20019]